MRKGFLGKEMFDLTNFFDGPTTLPYFENVGIIGMKRILEFLTNGDYSFSNGKGG